MLDTQLRKLAKSTEMLNLFQAAKDMSCFGLFENKKDLSKLQHTFLSYIYFYHSLNTDIALKKVSEKVLLNEIFENAYAHYRNNMKDEKTEIESNKERAFQGVFSKTNEIIFPSEVK
jgi:predicted metal-dependent hydrolase